MCHHTHGHLASTTAVKAAREVLPATPVHYRVEITPDLVNFVYKGVVDIDLKVKETISTIVCNSNELKIHSASVKTVFQKTESSQTATKISYDEKVQTASFDFPNAIEAGSTATLHIEFEGKHNDKMAGFYRSSYTRDGVKKHMVVTQFEATDCRRALPSWDEPNLKATFDVVLNIEKNLTALSNMNAIEEKDVTIDGKALKAVHFATTPIMSTYLLAFAVGDLEYIETTSTAKSPADAVPVTVRVYTLPGQKEQGRFALEVCARTLEFFSEYFDVAYPLPKMDLIAIPDFSAGAMENWGLVTYREIYVLYDEKSSSAKAKESVAYVVGHELAHQWFGNLVTMDWWSELWLNEGFATFVGWMATDHLFPEWKIWTSFITGDYARGKELDAMKSSHPIEVEVHSPSEIIQIFDAISYCKGASVIRMLNSYLGTETFKKGIRAYLRKHKFSNATTLDLWAALGDASGKDVAGFMYPWTRDIGYPLVTVLDEKFDEAKGELTLHLKQSRFLSSGETTAQEDADGTVWWVPLVITTHLNSKPTDHILSEKEARITIPYSKTKNSFFKLNFDTTGFYRVRLTEHQLTSLAAVIKADPKALSTEDKLGVLSDAFALAFSGQGSTVAALELLGAFEAEEDYNLLKEVSTLLDSVIDTWYLEPKEVGDGLRAIKRKLFSSKAKAMGFEYHAGENHLVGLKRTLVIEAAARANDQEVVAALQERFKKFIAGDESALPPNIRSIAYKTVLSNSKNSKEDFESILNIFKTATTPDQKLFALNSLGATNDPELVKRVLNEIALNTDLVRANDVPMCLSGLTSSNPDLATVRAGMWPWVLANWDTLVERYRATLSLLAAVVSLSVSPRVGQEVIDTIENWRAGKDLPTDEARAKRTDDIKSITRPIDQSVERVRGKTAWVNRARDSVAQWVKESGSK
ncbi:Aminopeptidase 2 mitochondrial [Geranomyces variabilis]|uniref:Aminopeptidase n=1 Tax=Geranomyces variabilis TaxID=109894 RepID=A0AAD5TP23_9FUNG|nr:Aminopeptidase 2 mitochondrial [Geranomyces variabilis]